MNAGERDDKVSGFNFEPEGREFESLRARHQIKYLRWRRSPPIKFRARSDTPRRAGVLVPLALCIEMLAHGIDSLWMLISRGWDYYDAYSGEVTGIHMISRTLLVRGTIVAATVLMTGFVVAQSGSAQMATGRNVEWTGYAANPSGSRFAPLDQINASNFNDLQVAWTFSTDNLGNRPEYKLEGTPLEIGGVVYTTGGNRRDVVALDAVTGELLWMHGEHEGERGVAAPRQLSGRGLSYWSEPDGKNARIIYVTPGYFLIALDARTGERIRSFGQEGAVDMKATDSQGIRRVTNHGMAEPNLTVGEIGWQSAPTVVGDEVLVGSAFTEGFTPLSHDNNKGLVQAFDVRTGKKLWEWDTIPKKGESGYETWLKDSADDTGNTGVWTQIAADPEAGLAYLPVESPTSDFYGGYAQGQQSLFR